MKSTMKSRLTGLAFILGTLVGASSATTPAPASFGPTPSELQLRWQEMEYYAFIHFSLNTYTDKAWGFGNEDINLFNPTDLDCRQWARICRDAGMKGIILTAKHHGGFCLWPSDYTDYSVKNAPWKAGQGDVVRELAEACAEYGLKFGIYLSPWDRNRADYGSPTYITYFRNQLTELLTNYGPIFEVWFDGAHGGDGYYGGANEIRTIDRKSYYDWSNTYKLVRALQPDIVIWNDGGDRADLRWVGTEEGYVGETNWSMLNAKGDVTWSMLHHGLENGDTWVPAEVNTSIRPEWFYHPAENEKVKSVPHLVDTYYKSVGRNATLLLNLPVMPNGLIHAKDEDAVLGMAEAIKVSLAQNVAAKATVHATNTRGGAPSFQATNAVDHSPETYWATDDHVTAASLTLELDRPTPVNRFLVQEHIRLGQRVKAFNLEAYVGDSWIQLASATTIGYKRILRFPTVEATRFRFNITDSRSCPLISNIGLFNAPLFLGAPSIRRGRNGEVSLATDDIGPAFYYTIGGSEPTLDSPRYEQPFPTDGKIVVKAIAHDPVTGEVSPVGREAFDIPRRHWRILHTDDPRVDAILDGDHDTVWHHSGAAGLPIDLVIDLGRETTLSGFRYLPDQGKRGSGYITTYEFQVSRDGTTWHLANRGEFSNIKNNPVWQNRSFDPQTARYIKLRTLANAAGNSRVGYAELDVMTVD